MSTQFKAPQFANNAVETTKLKDLAVTVDKLQAEAITLAKLAVKQPLQYQLVHRRPIFGFGGDTVYTYNDPNNWKQIGNCQYGLVNGYGAPAVQAGATRYCRLYVVYSDEARDASYHPVVWLDADAGSAYDLVWHLTCTWGTATDRRDYFTPLALCPTVYGHYYVKMINNAGSFNTSLYYMELQLFDVFP